MSRVSIALLALACAILMCGLAGAVDYGEIDVTPANCTQWSTNLSNNNSRVSGNIIVNNGAVLDIENATIRMDSTHSYKYSIVVRDNGTLNMNGSTITRDDSYYYGWRYESGSRGNLTNSTVTFCIYDNGFKVETNETISLFNVTFDHGNYGHPSGDCYGIYLNSASNASIRNCTIKTASTSQSNHRYTRGIYAYASNNTTISNSTVCDASDYGIYIWNSRLCNLTENNITDSGDDGIFMQSSGNATLLANNLTEQQHGCRQQQTRDKHHILPELHPQI
jgi:parallel beta-helix repeat protein